MTDAGGTTSKRRLEPSRTTTDARLDRAPFEHRIMSAAAGSVDWIRTEGS